MRYDLHKLVRVLLLLGALVCLLLGGLALIRGDGGITVLLAILVGVVAVVVHPGSDVNDVLFLILGFLLAYLSGGLIELGGTLVALGGLLSLIARRSRY